MRRELLGSVQFLSKVITARCRTPASAAVVGAAADDTGTATATVGAASTDDVSAATTTAAIPILLRTLRPPAGWVPPYDVTACHGAGHELPAPGHCPGRRAGRCRRRGGMRRGRGAPPRPPPPGPPPP